MRWGWILWLCAGSVWGWDALQSSAQVAAQINDPRVVIVDVSDEEVYTQEGHIHGAVHTHIGEWRDEVEKHEVIKPVEEIQKVIRKLGINSDSKVILYSHLNTPKDLLSSSYLYWAMKLHGVNEVAIMDGGMKQWVKDQRFVLHSDSVPVDGNFTALPDPKIVADLKYVKEHLGKLPMIDARASENYFGVSASNGVDRSGHIAGATSYFWMYSVTQELGVKSKEELGKIFAEGFGLAKEQEMIVYCTGGLETSFNYFVLNGMLGYKNVRLYDASMREWGNRTDTPMVRYRWEQYRP